MVVALVALNLYLWIRPGHDSAAPPAGAAATSAAATGATSTATPAAGATTSPPVTGGPSAGPSSGATSPGPAPGGGAPTVRSEPGPALRAAGRLIAVVDTSAAMESQLGSVKDGLVELFRKAPDGVTVGLIAYSPAGVQVVSPPARLDGGRRDALVTAVQGLTTTPGAGRPLFDALVLGYQYSLAGPPGTDPAPILMAVTNGGRDGGADLQTFTLFASTEAAKRARAAAPVFVAITPGADVPLLNQVAAEVGGTVLPAATPGAVRDAILALPSPRPQSPTTGSPTS